MNQNDQTTRSIPPKLFEILEHETRLYKEMLELLQDERHALVDAKVEVLIRLAQKKENQMLKIRLADESFQEMARSFAEDPLSKVISISSLVALTSHADGERLQEYLKTLSEMREQILDMNIFNKRFTEDVLRYLNDAITLIMGASAPSAPVYGMRGLAQQKTNIPTRISAEV